MSAAHDFADSIAVLEDVADEADTYAGVLIADEDPAQPAWADRLEAIARRLEGIAAELSAYR
ncbi:hypothetical protein [Nocardia sp. NPDC004711]